MTVCFSSLSVTGDLVLNRLLFTKTPDESQKIHESQLRNTTIMEEKGNIMPTKIQNSSKTEYSH
jgi:hypothetical protein